MLGTLYNNIYNIISFYSHQSFKGKVSILICISGTTDPNSICANCLQLSNRLYSRIIFLKLAVYNLECIFP